MPRNSYFTPDFADNALCIDQECGPLYAYVFLSIEALLAPDTIGLYGFQFGIGSQKSLSLYLALNRS